MSITAPALLKETAPDLTTPELGKTLAQFVRDKAYSVAVVRELGQRGIFGSMVKRLLLRDTNSNERNKNVAPVLDYFASRLTERNPPVRKLERYIGNPLQNKDIDGAVGRSRTPTSTGYFFRDGAASHYIHSDDSTKVRIPETTAIPIALVGYGAAGILASAMLRSLGFTNITAYEKKSSLGVWSQSNVYNRSRNNPRNVNFLGNELAPAPGGGGEVKNFLERLSYVAPLTAQVERIESKPFAHTLHFDKKAEPKTFPIVINCIGLGKPKPLSDEDHMITNVTDTQGGIRWQQTLTRDQVSGKRFAFVGLGNSTAEMLRQLHEFEDAGVELDYRVFTHYNLDVIENPDDEVEDPVNGYNRYRLFRDVSKPNLVDFQGDLPDSRRDYYRALRRGRIQHSVKDWRVRDNVFLSDASRDGYKYDFLYTLIGYKHDSDTLSAMGCLLGNGGVRYDFDGEMSRNIGYSASAKERINKGLFGFGAVLETPENPNAIVIPGMVHRAGDLAFAVMMRSLEYIRQAK